jgi:membrane protein YdbS with pleckstrin-like domain
MIKYLAQFIVLMVLWFAIMFGAWLGGADPGWWTVGIGVVVSLVIIGAIITHKSNP